MATEHTKQKIFRYCYHCKGTGKTPIFINGEEQEGEEDCKICNGTGRIKWGFVKEEEEEEEEEKEEEEKE